MNLKTYEKLLMLLFSSKKLEKLKLDYKVFPKDEAVIEISEISSLPNSFVEIYDYCNGFEVNWKATKIEQVYGNVEFLPLINVLSSWEETLYEKDDIKQGKQIIHFKPFDQVAPEILCGFLDKPNEDDNSIYLNRMGYTNISSLDIDFEGYIVMMCESRAYKNWPYILLHIIEQELNSSLITSFKKDMPEIFPDWSWDKFIERYESLRLSKK